MLFLNFIQLYFTSPVETNDFLWQKSPPGSRPVLHWHVRLPIFRVEFVFSISIVCHSSPTKILKWRSSDIILRPEVRSKLIQQIHPKMGVSQKLAPCFNPTNLSSHQNLQIFTPQTQKSCSFNRFFCWEENFPQQKTSLSRHLWAFLLERPERV